MEQSSQSVGEQVADVDLYEAEVFAYPLWLRSWRSVLLQVGQLQKLVEDEGAREPY